MTTRTSSLIVRTGYKAEISDAYIDRGYLGLTRDWLTFREANDVEDPEEVLMDENEEEIPRIGAKNGKKRSKPKDAMPVRVVYVFQV